MNFRRVAGVAAGLTLLATAGAACSKDESVFNAEVGECVTRVSDLSGNVQELPESDCSEDHEGEIFFLFEHEGDDDDFPGGSELQDQAAEDCEGDAFEEYTGTDYDESAIGVLYVTPSSESWSEGDRETICVGALISGDTVDESFKDNGEDFLLADLDPSDVPSGGDAGEDTSLDDFADDVDACQGGDMAACDTLYFDTPVGSEAETVAKDCGGEDEGGDHAGDCESTFG